MLVLTWRFNAVVTAPMRMCDMVMHRAFESPPTQPTVNQTAGVAVNAAAVQLAKASHARYFITSLPAA
jgi:hypothetical protein